MPEAENHRISVWNLDGDFKITFGSLRKEPGQLNYPGKTLTNLLGMQLRLLVLCY